jgi:hypothetical protein
MDSGKVILFSSVRRSKQNKKELFGEQLFFILLEDTYLITVFPVMVLPGALETT